MGLDVKRFQGMLFFMHGKTLKVSNMGHFNQFLHKIFNIPRKSVVFLSSFHMVPQEMAK